MEVLIEKGANVHKIALKGEEAVPLLYALSSHEFEPAKLLVRKGADVNAQQTPAGLTALQVLASLKLEGQSADRLSSEIVEMAKFLVKRKADVEAVNSRKETVLFAAVNSMNFKLVKYLLSMNAKVNVRNHCSQTPLHAAIVPCNATKAVVAMTSGAAISRHVGGGYTVNAPYIVPHQKEIVELLLKAGANLHSKDENLHTPLFLAVGNNNLEMAELLIERGAEVNGKNIDGLGVLHFAVKENNLHMVKCLVEIGKADLEISSKVGDTPLHIATYHKYHCIIQYLVDAKANVTAENCFHLCPLRMAVASDSSKLVKLLGKAGANCNSRTKDGSLLHFAVKYKHTKSVKSLLELGADVNEGDENKVSPFMVCIINLEYDSEFIQLLLDYGGDPLRPSKSGLTVYMCALARHEVGVLKVFWRFGCPTDELKIPHIYNALKKATGICSNNKSKFLQSPNSYLPFSERKMTKEEEDLRRAQTRFAEGIENNDAKQVADAIENGAVARGVTHSMAYPLHYAVIKGYHDVVEVLLTNGVPVNFVDSDRKTPLELAAFGSDLVMCQLLLSHGAHYYPGLGGSVFSYKSITSQLEEGHVEFLLSTEKNKDKSVDICNMKRRLNKLEKRCEEAGESREIRQIEKEIRKLKKDMYCCMRESTTEEKAVTNNVKSLKSLEKKLISCKSTLDLFFNIRRLFKIIRKQDSYSQKSAYLLLTKYLEANSTLSCTPVLNCLNNEGKTLMAAAIEAGNVEITEYIMNLRITDSKINTV